MVTERDMRQADPGLPGHAEELDAIADLEDREATHGLFPTL
jgi:hypothetical protein